MWFALFSIIFYISQSIADRSVFDELIRREVESKQNSIFSDRTCSNCSACSQHVPSARGSCIRAKFYANANRFLNERHYCRIGDAFNVSRFDNVVCLPIVYAFSIISLIFATFLSSHIIQMLNQNTLMLFHIGLSLFTYAVLFYCNALCDPIGMVRP